MLEKKNAVALVHVTVLTYPHMLVTDTELLHYRSKQDWVLNLRLPRNLVSKKPITCQRQLHQNTEGQSAGCHDPEGPIATL
jgi:hypothetical protein